MPQSATRRTLSVLRRYMGPLIFLVAVILTAAIITMGLTNNLPRWFFAAATVL